MNRIAKIVAAMQALLLAPIGAAKSADAAQSEALSEAARWHAAISSGSPEDLQRFITDFPQGERLGDAFEQIVEGEIAAAKSDSAGAVQLAEARRDPELLEFDFDPRVIWPDPEAQKDGGPTPY